LFEKKYRLNNQIKAREVRVIDEEGKNLGVMPTSQALSLAYERNLDLVEITEKVSPPVAKIMNFGKFLYQQKRAVKKERKRKELKIIRIGFKEGEKDLETKAKKIDGFLKEGEKVRIEIRLRGRERNFFDLGQKKLLSFLEKISQEYRIIQEVRRAPTGWNLVIDKKTAKNA